MKEIERIKDIIVKKEDKVNWKKKKKSKERKIQKEISVLKNG